MFPSKTAHSVAQSLSQPFKDSIPMTTFISGEFLNMTETSFVLYDPCVVCLASSLKKKIMELLKLLEAWWRSSGGRPASAKSVQLLHFHPLPSSNNNETFTFLCAVGVFHFSSMRILSSTRINKVEVKTGVRADVFLWKPACAISVFSSHFSCHTQKSFKVSLKHDAEGWEQLYTFCIWLRKTVPFSVCSCDDQYLSYPFSFSDSWGSVHGGFAKESKRVCGFVDICHSASVALFYQSELDSTKPSSILTWSQEDFFSFPFSLD